MNRTKSMVPTKLLVRARASLRVLVARWEAFVYQEDLMPDDLKDELANLFLAMMTAFFAGSVILRLFVRH